MSRRKARLGIAVFLLLLAASGRAQVSGKIEGTVVDEESKALPGVKVEVADPASGSRTVTTDKSGRYRFVGLRPGNYKVSFTLDSHADVQKSATVRLDATATVNAKMFRIAR